MTAGFEIKICRFAPLPDLDIVVLVFTRWNIRQGQVGHFHQPGLLAAANLVEFSFSATQLLTQLFDLVQQRLDVFSPALGLAYGFCALVFLVLQFLYADLQALAARFQFTPGTDIEVESANFRAAATASGSVLSNCGSSMVGHCSQNAIL